MSEPVWYKSLYWRIGFGFIAMQAALLLAQGFVFLWFTDRIVGGSSRSPEQLAALVSSDLSTALAKEPKLDLETYVRKSFGHIYQPFLVVMRDGRTASNRPTALPPNFGRGRRGPGGGGGRDNDARDRGPGPGGPPPDSPPPDSTGPRQWDGRPRDGGGGPRQAEHDPTSSASKVLIALLKLVGDVD